MKLACPESDQLSPTQASGLTGLSVQRLRQLMEMGVLQGQRTPIGYLYDRQDVERLAAVRAGRVRVNMQQLKEAMDAARIQ